MRSLAALHPLQQWLRAASPRVEYSGPTALATPGRRQPLATRAPRNQPVHSRVQPHTRHHAQATMFPGSRPSLRLAPLTLTLTLTPTPTPTLSLSLSLSLSLTRHRMWSTADEFVLDLADGAVEQVWSFGAPADPLVASGAAPQPRWRQRTVGLRGCSEGSWRPGTPGSTGAPPGPPSRLGHQATRPWESVPWVPPRSAEG